MLFARTVYVSLLVNIAEYLFLCHIVYSSLNQMSSKIIYSFVYLFYFFLSTQNYVKTIIVFGVTLKPEKISLKTHNSGYHYLPNSRSKSLNDLQQKKKKTKLSFIHFCKIFYRQTVQRKTV